MIRCRLEKPADFSFMNFKRLKGTKPDTVHTTRIGTPQTGIQNKFLTRAVWLNNNRLTDVKYLDIFIDSILEDPRSLAWLDLSFNNITEIDLCILKFTNLTILYLHGNNISDVKELLKLKGIKPLKTLTVHGNPVYSKKNYRQYLITVMPQILTLDFTRVTAAERTSAMALERKVE